MNMSAFTDNATYSCPLPCKGTPGQTCGNNLTYVAYPIISTSNCKINSPPSKFWNNNATFSFKNILASYVGFALLRPSTVNAVNYPLNLPIINITYQNCSSYCRSVSQLPYALLLSTVCYCTDLSQLSGITIYGTNETDMSSSFLRNNCPYGNQRCAYVHILFRTYSLYKIDCKLWKKIKLVLLNLSNKDIE